MKDGDKEKGRLISELRELNLRNAELKASESKRIKELNCLYSLSKLIEQPDISLEELLKKTVCLIQESWQYPDITCAKIVFENKEFKTNNFQTTRWKQSAAIKEHEKERGSVDVYYLEDRPELYEGPFLKEERNLIDAVSERLGKIIEHKLAQEALRESEEKFGILSEQSLLGVVIFQNGLIKYANKAFSEISEYSVGEMLNWKSDDFLRTVYSEDQSFVMEKIQKEQAEADVANHYQFRIVTKTGSIKWIEIYSKTIHFYNRKTDVITIIDITEKKSAEERAKAQQQQLIQADRLASLGVLVAGVAHEINNPNHTIMSNANRVSEAWKNIAPILKEYYESNGDFIIGGLDYTEMCEEMPVYIEGISDGAKRIDAIVSDLKNFSRQEDYRMTADVDVNLLVKAAIIISNNFIRKYTKDFSVEFVKDIPKIKGNFQRLEQVIINLLQNACQALPDNKKAIFVTTSYNKNKQCVEINVRDEGIGILLEDLLRIKDPFFTSKRNSGGTGLGLSVSATIIEDHHGTLSFTSELKKGTTATIKLPITECNKV